MRLDRMVAIRAIWRAGREVRQPGAPGIGERFRALPRMTGLTLQGRYPGLARRRLALFAFAVLYLVSPVDLVPDFLPLIGLGDDVVVLTWLVGSLLGESAAFLAWEAGQRRSPVVTGQVIEQVARP